MKIPHNCYTTSVDFALEVELRLSNMLQWVSKCTVSCRFPFSMRWNSAQLKASLLLAELCSWHLNATIRHLSECDLLVFYLPNLINYAWIGQRVIHSNCLGQTLFRRCLRSALKPTTVSVFAHGWHLRVNRGHQLMFAPWFGEDIIYINKQVERMGLHHFIVYRFAFVFIAVINIMHQYFMQIDWKADKRI